MENQQLNSNDSNHNQQSNDVSQQFFQPSINQGPMPGTTVGPASSSPQGLSNANNYSANPMVSPPAEMAGSSVGMSPQTYQADQPNTPQLTQEPTESSSHSKPTKKNNKKLMIVVIVAVVFLLVLTILAVVLGSSSQKKTPSQATQTTTPTSTSIDPATSLGIEQINNSINQDITSQNDDADFPPTQLDDKALEL